MAKVMVEMDTDTKSLKLTIDDKVVDNPSEICFYVYEHDEVKKIEFSASQNEENGNVYKNTRYYARGNEIVKSQDVDISKLINSKKSSYVY